MSDYEQIPQSNEKSKDIGNKVGKKATAIAMISASLMMINAQRTSANSNSDFETFPSNIEDVISQQVDSVIKDGKVAISSDSPRPGYTFFSNIRPYNETPDQIIDDWSSFARAHADEIISSEGRALPKLSLFLNPFSYTCTDNQAIKGIVRYRLNPKNTQRVQIQIKNMITDNMAVKNNPKNPLELTDYNVPCSKLVSYRGIIGGMVVDKARKHFLAGANKKVVYDNTKSPDISKPRNVKQFELNFRPNKDKSRPRVLMFKLTSFSRVHSPNIGAKKQTDFGLKQPSKNWKQANLNKGEKDPNIWQVGSW